jgi:tetratricopeptide (TPR) repeat protein
MKHDRFILFHTFCFLLLGTSTALGQSVYWSPSGGTLGHGKATPLSLVFDNCEPSVPPDLPQISGLEFSRPSRSEQNSFINGRSTHSVEYVYRVSPTRKGSVRIPPLTFKTDEGSLTTLAVNFQVGEASVGQTGLPIDQIVQTRLQITETKIWVGQVINIEYILTASTQHNVGLTDVPKWNPEGLILQPFGEPQKGTFTVGNEKRNGLLYQTKALVTQAGTIEISPVQQHVSVETGRRRNLFFSQPEADEFLMSSNNLRLTVLPLPTPAPDDFHKAVGKFSVESLVVPTEASVGEPITWTLSLKGRGNWPANLYLPSREVPTSFEVVQPQSKQEMDEGNIFSGNLTEDIVLVPQKAGTYEIGSFSYSYFDPEKGIYQREKKEAVSVTITEASASTSSAVYPSNTDKTLSLEFPSPTETDDPFLPHPPIEGFKQGRKPLQPYPLSLLWFILLPPFLCWIFLSFRSAIQNDPRRSARIAKEKLKQVLGSLSKNLPEKNRNDLLLLWMEYSAQTLRISQALPTSEQIPELLEKKNLSASIIQDWQKLWKGVEKTLYAKDGDLPENWQKDARVTLSQTPVARIQFSTLFRLRSWLPLFAIIFILCSSPLEMEAGAMESYKEGDFSDAEEGWRQALQSNPTDLVARNNLALALSQQERWTEANAYWSSAFLLDPRDEVVLWNLKVGQNIENTLSPTLAKLTSDKIGAKMIRQTSPGNWSWLLLSGAIMLSLALCFYIVIVRQPGKKRRMGSLIIATVGLLLMILSQWALTDYGILAHPRAHIISKTTELYSIPTEAVDEQQVHPLPAGAIALPQKSFLGWTQIILENEEVGWVRQEYLISLYEAADEH